MRGQRRGGNQAKVARLEFDRVRTAGDLKAAGEQAQDQDSVASQREALTSRQRQVVHLEERVVDKRADAGGWFGVGFVRQE